MHKTVLTYSISVQHVVLLKSLTIPILKQKLHIILHKGKLHTEFPNSFSTQKVCMKARVQCRLPKNEQKKGTSKISNISRTTYKYTAVNYII